MPQSVLFPAPFFYQILATTLLCYCLCFIRVDWVYLCYLSLFYQYWLGVPVLFVFVLSGLAGYTCVICLCFIRVGWVYLCYLSLFYQYWLDIPVLFAFVLSELAGYTCVMVMFLLVFSSPGRRPCELLPSLEACRRRH